MQENYNENFTAEELEFQRVLVETNFSILPIHQCLATVDELIESFLTLKTKFEHQPEKRYGLLVQLQLLKAKNSFLMEKCFADDDALARFFFLHERITSIHEILSEPYVPEANEENENAAAQVEESEHSEELEGEIECPICYLEFPYCDTMQYKDCQHRYCKEVSI